MWLLSSYRAELHHFIDHTSVEGGYAILSYTWGLSEQTYQDLRDIGETCRETGENPRDFVSEKIRQSCILAEEHGYRWIWVDYCCIDKSSSSELSEAINSMFTWYADSEVCFAYLDDVPSDCDFEAPAAPSVEWRYPWCEIYTEGSASVPRLPVKLSRLPTHPHRSRGLRQRRPLHESAAPTSPGIPVDAPCGSDDLIPMPKSLVPTSNVVARGR